MCKGCPLRLSFKDGQVHGAQRQVDIGNTTIFLEVTSFVIENKTENMLFGVEVVRNVTERKRVEEQIINFSKFPSENPNPVLRITDKAKVIYKKERNRNCL